MKYGIISDTHDNYYNLEQAIKIVNKHGLKTCFHLGDFCAPGIVSAMTAHENLQWICVWGNVDGAKAEIFLRQKNNPNFNIVAGSFREEEINGKKIFLTHYPLLARQAAEVGEYLAVFHGHNHLKKGEVLANGTLIANPGEICGFKTGQPSFGIWDSETNKMEIIDLTDFRVAK